MVGVVALIALPMAGLWLALSKEQTLDSFIVGYIFGFAVLTLVRSRTFNMNSARIPSQILALVQYTAVLLWEILLSSTDVALRVLNPKCPVSPGILETSTQDADKDTLIAALSMHAITVTPGEMVIAYDEDTAIMTVHCLNAETARDTLAPEQAERLKLIKRMLGR